MEEKEEEEEADDDDDDDVWKRKKKKKRRKKNRRRRFCCFQETFQGLFYRPAFHFSQYNVCLSFPNVPIHYLYLPSFVLLVSDSGR